MYFIFWVLQIQALRKFQVGFIMCDLLLWFNIYCRLLILFKQLPIVDKGNA